MYRFVDITKQQSVVDLPSEAMQVNGVYLENEISGYRTLYTEGRETLETEISTIDNDYIDGAIEDSARDLSRAVTALATCQGQCGCTSCSYPIHRLISGRSSTG